MLARARGMLGHTGGDGFMCGPVFLGSTGFLGGAEAGARGAGTLTSGRCEQEKSRDPQGINNEPQAVDTRSSTTLIKQP